LDKVACSATAGVAAATAGAATVATLLFRVRNGAAMGAAIGTGEGGESEGV